VLNLDPTKLLIIAVVAVILLGPDKLPQVGRQAGAAWRSFNEFRHRMESEVRNSIPDLPSSADIARLARSPSALLNHLSTLSPDEADKNGAAANGAAAYGTADGAAANGAVADGAAANGTADGAAANGAVADGNGTSGEVHARGDATSADPSGAESHGEHAATPAPAATPTMPTAPKPPTPSTASTPSIHSTHSSAGPTTPPLPGPGAVGDPSLN
jgi:TatA/E family protein of Tat protein translocase